MISNDQLNKTDKLKRFMKEVYGVTPDNIDEKLEEVREEVREKLKKTSR